MLISYIVATGPGGASDLVARVIGPPLSDLPGVQLVIDNRTGAGNTVGAEIAARAAPDGYTPLSCNIASLAKELSRPGSPHTVGQWEPGAHAQFLEPRA